MYYIGNIQCVPSDIQHFGILGMKWGVRRYQNKDGTLTDAGKDRYFGKQLKRIEKTSSKGGRDESLTKERTIPAGATMYRTSIKSKEDGNGPVYVSYVQADREHYKAGWIRQTGNSDKAYEHTFKVKEDIKIPSRDHVYDVVNVVMKDDKKLLNETAEAWFNVVYPKSGMAYQEWIASDNKKEERERIKKIKDDILQKYGNYSQKEAAYFCMQTFGLNNKLKMKVIDKLKSQGYNAMTDEASVGGQHSNENRQGIDPLILFDRGSLNTTSVSEISREEESSAESKYYDWYDNANNFRTTRKYKSW